MDEHLPVPGLNNRTVPSANGVSELAFGVRMVSHLYDLLADGRLDHAVGLRQDAPTPPHA